MDAEGTRRARGSGFSGLGSVVISVAAVVLIAASAADGTQSPVPQSASPGAVPELTQPVNDFAHVIDAASARQMDALSRSLQAKTGDVVVVATVPNLQPFGDDKEYAVKLFENRGRGIGQKGKDNGLLILLAPNDRKVRIEVGYDLEQFITDGYAGETSRMMAAQFRSGTYGPGLLAGMQRVVARIAQQRGVTLDNLPVPRAVEPPRGGPTPIPFSVLFWIFIAILIVSRIGGRGRRRRFWGGGPWSGWSSGVGPFGGGGWGGGSGGFGGGFGGFGGGRSGGGGGGASW